LCGLTVHIKDDELDRAYSTQGRYDMTAKFRPEHLDRRHNLRDLDVNGRIILTRFLQKYGVA
jgi:hypothetical protein